MSEANHAGELRQLIIGLCDDELDESRWQQLGQTLVADEVARLTYVRQMIVHARLDRELEVLLAESAVLDDCPLDSFRTEPVVTRGLNGSRSDGLPANGSASRPLFSSPRTCSSPPLPPASQLPGYLNVLLRVAHKAPGANALTWLVMAFLCSGMVLTIFMCIVLVFREVGVNGRTAGQVEAPQTAKNSSPSAKSAVNEDRPGDRGEGFVATPSSAAADVPRVAASVARLIHADDCHWAIGSHSPNQGDDLMPGRKLALLSGVAEVMFQSGVRALLEGPATMEVVSSRSTRLLQGKLTVRVEDPDAIGFQVRTPDMKYTDLGTEFGVCVAKDGTETMVVFRGQVRAELALKTGKAEMAGGMSHPMILRANEAVRVSSAKKDPDKSVNNSADKSPEKNNDNSSAKRIERIAAAENLFVRGPEPFPLFGTGAGLPRGAADSRWEIVEVSTDPDFKPRPARVVLNPVPSYVHGALDKGQWISLAAEDVWYPEDCRWTFRTKFDLTGFDPKSARIEGQFAVDNFIVALRVNGQPLPIVDRGDYTRYHSIEIDKGFVAGVNTLEVEILNGLGGAEMGLCVDYKGTARRLVKRD